MIVKERYYKVNAQVFEKLAKKWYRKKKSWKWLNLLFWFFILLGVAAIVNTIVHILEPESLSNPDIVLTFALCGSIFAFLPFMFAYITKSQAIRRVGKPYSAMRKIFLYTNYSGLQFGYHDHYEFKKPQSAIVNQISYPNIHHVEVNEADHMVTVIGKTERVEYEDMITGRTRFEFTKGQFGDMASFSFFDGFEDIQAFYDELKAHDVKIEFV